MRRSLLRLLHATLFALPLAAHAETTLKVGDQQLQTRGVLEASGQLKDVPYRIEWFNFPAAQPLGEALNAGAIDIGGLGDAPLIFAYAAGAKVRAVSATRSTPVDLAIVVPQDSPIHNAADLKGKRIATTRGSIGHYLAVATLERANIKLTDVSWHYMQPADAKAALASGTVDAWSTWDPYVALSEARDHDRSIANGVGLSSGLSFEAATDDSIRAKRAEIADFLKRVAAGQRWALAHPDEVAAIQSRVTGLPPDVLKTVYQRAQLHPVPIDDGLIAEQQKTADLYHRADVIKTRLDVTPSFDKQFSQAAQ
ncbi:ABC transporter substrate-binding protein [Paraburkholderia caballeronis]|uniref:Putative aliphatic sulfonates-binding protein n=1 Tax=Paraburkholderia caballeronis TaxID=416943 RepID=A0A1H7LHB5_9BURK|nr:ABC transporter substrate-binding protein [Paraburkholderia caballeronis]PXW28463.1 sulfonate transport system substrate-binding protein [Paraburkholderia caballeronis]PXX03829.1 sulfonate transport system substrate-binding protein [Paraburkholderia caballeronis]RAK04573.1 sulfonate transport system substrate-binding protein [Paraburkholderia caballeronis]TDV39387.1 sulfonate transport system substrate-binding protein [Paraburkholderia caballeronis]SED74511.1 sulfonate transport system subs